MRRVKKNLAVGLALIATLAYLPASSARPKTLPFAKAKSEGELAARYKSFLDKARTPKESIQEILRSQNWQLVDLSKEKPRKVRSGDRLAFVGQDRHILLVVVGSRPISEGARMLASHIDTPSPRLATASLQKGADAALDAYAHGGLKGSHWLHRPLQLRGEIVAEDGKKYDISIGENENFSFYISARRGRQYTVKLSAGNSKSDGKKLNSKTKAKQPDSKATTSESNSPQGFLDLLWTRHTLYPKDIHASELYLVPKSKARWVGLDKSMIGAHGHDDRVNSFLAWQAISGLRSTPKYTAMAWLADREETGSQGRTGAQSEFFELVYAYLLRSEKSYVSEAMLANALGKNLTLSADTPACINPNWSEVHEVKHGPIIGKGPAVFPGTGRRGKVGGSQASISIVDKLHRIFASKNIPVQPGELGRVDEGGGGTVAKYLEHRGVQAVDLGVCVIAMHSPFELVATKDLWWTLQGFTAWLLDGR